MARKFPSKKVDYKEASQILISGHFGPWFNHELPGPDNDADFSDCEEFENYHPPGEPESEDSSLEDEDEDLEEEDSGEQNQPADPSTPMASPSQADDNPPSNF